MNAIAVLRTALTLLWAWWPPAFGRRCLRPRVWLPPTPLAFPTAVGLVIADLRRALPMVAGLPPLDGSVVGSADGSVAGSNVELNPS